MILRWDEKTLKRYSEVTLILSEIRADYAEQLKCAKSREEVAKIAKEAQRKMIATIGAADGLDLKTYVKISEFSQREQDLSERIDQILTSKRGGRNRSPEEG